MHKILMEKTEAHQHIKEVCSKFNNSGAETVKKGKKAATKKTKIIKKVKKV